MQKQSLQLIFWQTGINTPDRPIDQFIPTTNIHSRTIAPSKLKKNSIAAEYPI
ncbi:MULTISPECIES: hypothetical protein [unclassified Microcoleus]|uniref:hypothetical protein n=1 Tax=unclassified Microcoleus TaxID=2642155 RepID=UPI002FCE7A1F